MGRPRKDGTPSVVKPKLYDSVKVPVGTGLFVTVRYPKRGFSMRQARLAAQLLEVIAEAQDDERELEDDDQLDLVD